MNRYLKLSIIPLIVSLPSCMGGFVDCDDVNQDELSRDHSSYILYSLLGQKEDELEDSVYAYWKQGMKELSNQELVLERKLGDLDQIKNDSIDLLKDESYSRLDAWWKSKNDTIRSMIANLKFKGDGKLVMNIFGEPKGKYASGLNKEVCFCKIQFELNGENGTAEYQITKYDRDFTSSQEVVNSTLLESSLFIPSKNEWEYILNPSKLSQ